MPYVAFSQPIPNVTEATMGRGYVECIPWTKAYTEALANNVYDYFVKHRTLAEKKPLGMIMPKHGVVVSGNNIYTAYSMLERIEADAFCVLAKGIMWPTMQFPENN